MSQLNTPEELIKQRFDALFLDVKSAQLIVKNADKPVLSVIEMEQSKTIRSLLRVEKQAIQEKDLNNKSNLSLLQNITGQINVEVEKRLEEELKDIDHIYTKIIGFDNVLPELLDLVSIKAATISKIEPLATALPWLYVDLMKFVNQPKYRRTNNKGRVVLVENMRVALNFFGLDNLSIIITSLALRRALPQITDPYPQLKVRIWEEALATAMACKKLAGVVSLHQNQAFCLGMLQILGKVVISKLYFRHFEAVQRDALIETQAAQKHEEHAALTKISPSGEFLNELIGKYALSISAALIEKMQMKRVFIASAMREVSEQKPAQDLSPMGLVLRQGIAYAHYRILKGHKLIDLAESKDFIRTLNLPKGALQVLKNTDMRSIELINSDPA